MVACKSRYQHHFIPMKSIFFTIGFLVFLSRAIAQETDYGEHQPFASYWFVQELLEWSFEKDANAKFNRSQVPLASRFLNDSTTLGDDRPKVPGIISLVAPHTTSKHPSQGFPSVNQYAFPYWQYIDYFVQWGGSAAEGIIVPPLATWTDAAHKNGVKAIGTVFFPPNVYGGKQEWVYQFLQQKEDGSFPVADQLIAVAESYNFDGWFINQETYDLKSGTAKQMIEFIEYYRRNSNLKLVWYDAMIDDSRVIWQDELNNHNQVFFQKEGLSMSDVFFINFRYNPVNLEDSKTLANKLGRSEWDLYAGIDVQAKSYRTVAQWDALFDEKGPKNTSIGLYWPNSTFDISETKEPEDVYRNENKFWNGGTEIKTRFAKSKWKGFAKYFEPRSVINTLPFKTNFNYGLGRFYKENGVTVSNKEWHNLSIQDILPTWQWQVDSTKVRTTLSFEDSYEGGSSLLLEGTENTKIPLYKTNIELDKKLYFEVVSKSMDDIALEFFVSLSNGEELDFPLKRGGSWAKTKITIPTRKNIKLVSMGIKTLDQGKALLGEISMFQKKQTSPAIPDFTVQIFPKEEQSELYIHFNTMEQGVQHTIYSVNAQNEKRWLGRTPSQDYYISALPLSAGTIKIAVQSVGSGGHKGKMVYKTLALD